MTVELRSVIESLAATIKRKQVTAADAYWRMAATGRPEEAQAAEAAEKELRLFLSDRETFATLKTAQANPTGDQPLDRQVDRLYRSYLENQLAPEEISTLVAGATELEQLFANFRGEVDGQSVTENEIRDILVKSNDSEVRRKAWLASKQIGRQVAPKLVELVKARNAAARRLGFRNFYEMQLELSEIKKADLFGLMADMKELTDQAFAAMKRELDGELAARFGVQPSDLRPWHYADPFFQEVPSAGGVDLDPYFADKSVEELATRFYASVGMDVTDILSRSDLYERPGKNQHAFCSNIDREGDIRILCNLQPDSYWMATLLHELGHGVYEKYVDRSLPWLIREEAHINSTEAVAMYFGRLIRDAHWLHTIAGLPEGEANALAEGLQKEQSRSMLIFVRWVLVMVEFESRLYENPEQDLNRLWWNLVRDLQLVSPPAELNGCEWAAKIHLSISPVYYHNYLIGEVTASHLKAHIAKATGTERIASNPGVGQWLRERFFRPGALYPWNRLIEEATGESLNPQYFATEFVR